MPENGGRTVMVEKIKGSIILSTLLFSSSLFRYIVIVIQFIKSERRAKWMCVQRMYVDLPLQRLIRPD